MNVLDLCCCKGGAAKGILNACPDAHIIGVDNVLNHQEDYPGKFLWLDVRLLQELHPDLLEWADFIWASFPCQAYTYASKKARNLGKKYPDLIAWGRDWLLSTGKPFVMENVPTAPLRKDLILCGQMFGLKVIRHRVFELHGFSAMQLNHIKHLGKVKDGFYVTVAGHGGDGKASLKVWQEAMEISWTKDKKAIAQAVPPKYSEYIFSQFLKHKKVKAGCNADSHDNGIPPNTKELGILPTIL